MQPNAGRKSRQLPATQISSWLQTLPQEPQLLLSLLVSAQPYNVVPPPKLEPHRVRGAVQVVAVLQVPPSQTWPAVHVVPHAPHARGLVLVSTQVVNDPPPPVNVHDVRPGRQTHLPLPSHI